MKCQHCGKRTKNLTWTIIDNAILGIIITGMIFMYIDGSYIKKEIIQAPCLEQNTPTYIPKIEINTGGQDGKRQTTQLDTENSSQKNNQKS